MREIKFRAFHKEQKRMFPVLSFDEYEIIEADSDIIETGEDAIGRCRINSYDADKCILMQFAGLKDKNGKEIYEGDMIRGHLVYDWDKNDIGIVKQGIFKADSSGDEYTPVSCLGFYYEIVKSKNPNSYNGGFPGNDIEVLGNIHENQELLEGKR